jgi:hypothetical protein
VLTGLVILPRLRGDRAGSVDRRPRLLAGMTSAMICRLSSSTPPSWRWRSARFPGLGRRPGGRNTSSSTYDCLLGVARSAVGGDGRSFEDRFQPSIVAVMQPRSRTVEMPSGLSLPLAFGMKGHCNSKIKVLR